MQYSTDQLVKEVENSIAEFKQYNQDYDEDSIRQQVWLFLAVNTSTKLQPSSVLTLMRMYFYAGLNDAGPGCPRGGEGA